MTSSTQPSTLIHLTEDELHIIFDALDRLLASRSAGNLAFLTEVDTNGRSFRRLAENARAHIVEHLG